MTDRSLLALIQFDELGVVSAVSGGNKTIAQDSNNKYNSDLLFKQAISKYAGRNVVAKNIVNIINKSVQNKMNVCGLKRPLHLLFSENIRNNQLGKKHLENIFNPFLRSGHIKNIKYNVTKGCHEITTNPMPQDNLIDCIRSGLFLNPTIQLSRKQSTPTGVDSIHKLNERMHLTNALLSYLSANDIVSLAIKYKPELQERANNFQNLLTIPLVGTATGYPNECVVYLMVCFEYEEKTNLNIASKELKNIVSSAFTNDDQLNIYLKHFGLTGRPIEKCRVRWLLSNHPIYPMICGLYCFTFTNHMFDALNNFAFNTLRDACYAKKWEVWSNRSESDTIHLRRL